MTEQELELARKRAQAEYHREWRKKNPEKVRDANRRYWQRKALKLTNVDQSDAEGEING